MRSLSSYSLHLPGREWENYGEPGSGGETTRLLRISGRRLLLPNGDVSEVSKIASVRKSMLGILSGSDVAPDNRVLPASMHDLGLDDLEPFEPLEQHPTLQHPLRARSVPRVYGSLQGFGTDGQFLTLLPALEH